MPFENTVTLHSSPAVEIFYKIYGAETNSNILLETKPTLIWLHGGPGFDHSLHEPFISTIANLDIQVILMDLRGQGRSGDQIETNRWNLAQWGDDVYEFCKTLKINKPIIGGLSYGGAVAQSYMLRHPEQPAGIILCDTDAHVNKQRMLDTFYQRAFDNHMEQGETEIEATTKANRVRQIAEHVFNDPTDQAALEEHFANGIPLCGTNRHNTENPMGCILRMEVAKQYFQNELFSYDFRPEFKEKVQYPVLVMYGDKNAVHSLQSAQDTLAALPDAYTQAAYFKNAATPVYDNEPERARTLIADFCKKCNKA